MRIAVSSSIENFKDKLLKRTGLQLWRWFSKEPTIFFGLYHWVDYLKFVTHRGKRKVFFCGSDIRNLTALSAFFLRRIPAQHYCENEVEAEALRMFGFIPKILPMIFTDLPDVSFTLSDNTHVWMSTHFGREKEYGVQKIIALSCLMPDVIFHVYGDVSCWIPKFSSNLVFHGKVPEARFNEEIKKYHASIRFNEFDGFSEVTAKSVLMGQYPISVIKYPYIDSFSSMDEFVELINDLRNKTEPNPAHKEWRLLLENNLKILCDN